MESNGEGRHDEPRHPIRVVATRTGLTAAVLRAWERRYGVVEPARSEGRQRLYSDADIEWLRTLKRATDAGRSIGSVAELPREEVRQLVREDEEAVLRRELMEAGSSEGVRLGEEEESLRSALEAVENLDSNRLEAELRRGLVAFGAASFSEGVVAPLLRTVGERWRRGELRPTHEHLASAVIHRLLGWMLESAAAVAEGPAVVVGTLSGERHELGALLAAVAASLEGWRVTYLGVDLPGSDLALAARSAAAAAVAVSVICPGEGSDVARELAELREGCPEGCVVVVGGGGASTLLGGVERRDDVVLVDSLEEFRSRLRLLG